MNRAVKSLILAFVIAISIVLVSIPVWRISKGRNIGLIANSYGELPISVKVGKFESLIVIDDELVKDVITPTKITLRNRNGFEKNYSLYLLVEKKSSISYELLKLSINDTIYNLSEIEKSEDEENYYFKLIESSLKEYSEEEYDAKIWIKSNAQNLDGSSTLTANFIIK